MWHNIKQEHRKWQHWLPTLACFKNFKFSQADNDGDDADKADAAVILKTRWAKKNHKKTHSMTLTFKKLLT